MLKHPRNVLFTVLSQEIYDEGPFELHPTNSLPSNLRNVSTVVS